MVQVAQNFESLRHSRNADLFLVYYSRKPFLWSKTVIQSPEESE